MILASVLLKMGTYGFLRFCLPITPGAAIGLLPALQWLSVAGIIYGGLTALAQQDMLYPIRCIGRAIQNMPEPEKYLAGVYLRSLPQRQQASAAHP